ncbi:MAG: ABC transporter ATP-binding protein [Anaerolineales bacterium]|nr:ABC transporter ATP-binding protein [Anaerolineales bacterium]
MISIKNLLVQRNGRDSLKIESLTIKKGETLAVVGPNGAGKSTFLLTLADLLKPVRGEVRFHEKPLKEWDELEYRRKIAFVFQDPLLMDMSVKDNIGLGLKFRGVKKEAAREQVFKWSKAMGVDSLLNRRAGQLSGGEAQRVSLARAFVLDPELLLMDEPFSAVDPQTRSQLLKDLSKVLAQDHRTTIFVTHNLKEAAQFGDRVAVIIDGELKQVGKPKQIKGKPVDKSVRAFLKEL